ncbi:MAG: Protein TolA [Massilia sp.]|nr:Protein TolA [Massilia sp.]MDB5950561.1 Protein TolA [Massilia sp.]
MPNTPVTPAGVPYQVPPEPNRWPSIALAAAVHAGLLAFLFIGVNWQNTEPVAVEAEVWDMKTQAAAPPPPPPPPEAAEPAPRPEPAPKAIEPPPVEKTAPPPVDKPVAPKPPDIALEREKRKAEQRKLLEEQREQREEDKKREEVKLAKEAKERKQAEQVAERKADQKAQEAEKKLADRKAEAEQKLAEQKLADKKLAEKQLADKKLADKKLAEKQAADKLKSDKLAKAKSEAAEQAKLDQVRADEMRRITASAGTSGDAAKSTASRIDSGYLASITSKIKSTTSYAGSTDVPGNPKVVFKVEELPTGEIISVRLVKSSGIAAFDEAVERGINKASPLPKKKDGTVARTVEVAFSMKDLN